MYLQLSRTTYIDIDEVLCVFETSEVTEEMKKHHALPPKPQRKYTLVFKNKYEIEINYKEYNRLCMFLRDDAIMNGAELSERVIKREKERHEAASQLGKQYYKEWKSKVEKAKIAKGVTEQ
jgi:hypothetical protein